MRYISLTISLLSLGSLAHSHNATLPTRYGIILFPGFTALDVFGPMEALTGLSYTTHLANLSLIAETLSPVSGYDVPWATIASGSTFGSSVVPTHTFANPPELDVLILPGGLGTRAPSPLLNSTIDFVRKQFGQTKYFLSVCTGAGIAARAGVLDGRRATTNKRAWAQTTAWGPKVKWVAEARWTRDGHVWTSSGVSAGIDATIAFIEHIYGNATATTVANGMEYVRHLNASFDPFAGLYGLSSRNNTNGA